MKYEQYISLIKKLEKEAKENKKSYRFKLKALAFLGYFYFVGLAFLPLLVIVSLGAVIWFVPTFLWVLIKLAGKLIWLLVVFIGGLLSALFGAFKSFFQEIKTPQGYELKRDETPDLFQVIDEISHSINSPKPDHVLVNNDFNASVMTIPRYGFFGKKVFLNLGLPMMEVVSAEQFRAILAHEFGHISKKHGSDAAWIYQLRETWRRFLESQEESESEFGSMLYGKFVNWYFPYFNAYSFVLAREQEREADKMAVELFGAKPLAESLINTEIKGNFLDKDYWKNVFNDAKTKTQPPDNVFSNMVNAFRMDKDEGKDILTLTKALSVRTDYQDTHPSLNERLELINYSNILPNGQPKLPETIEISAAKIYLGNLKEKLTKQFDREWQNDVRQVWSAHHEYLSNVEKRINELSEKWSSEELSEDELYELAELKATMEDNQSAIPLLEKVLEKNPNAAIAKFSLGCILLENDDEKGIELLKEVMTLDRSLTIPVCEQLYAYLHSKHRDEEALPYLREADNFYDVISAAERERATVTDIDEFEPHDLTDEHLNAVIQQISYHEEIQEAFLVKKKVKNIPESPCYVLGIVTKKNWLGRSVGVKDSELLDVVVEQAARLNIQLVMILGKQFKGTKEKIENIPNSKIYHS